MCWSRLTSLSFPWILLYVEVPLILGRPFLATCQDLSDVSNGKIILRVGDEVDFFALSDAI